MLRVSVVHRDHHPRVVNLGTRVDCVMNVVAFATFHPSDNGTKRVASINEIIILSTQAIHAIYKSDPEDASYALLFNKSGSRHPSIITWV